MGVRWRIGAAATLLVLLTLSSACPDEFKNGPCQCNQLIDGALVVECHQADLSAVMNILGSDLMTVVSKLAFYDSPISTLRSQDLGSVNIRSLKISNCNLTTIEAGAFSGQADELEELSLANNALSKWPAFGNLGELKMIDLSGNALTDVSKNAFAGMPNLQQLWLGQNKICQLSLNALDETKASLELLDLSGNCLSVVPVQNLRDANRLQHLDLSSNRISDVSIMQFMNLPQLKEVRLNGNTITRINAMPFMNFPELRYLFLRDNRISTVADNRFQRFRKLKVLDLTGNLISSVPAGSFKEMSSLKQLFLDNNLIKKIDTLAFSANSKLRIISLQNNRLKTLSRNAFDSLDRMGALLLANNSLTDLDYGMFDGMHNLQLLNLRNNSLSGIGDRSFDAVPMLTSLDLAYNKLTAIRSSTLSSLKHLVSLDLSNNRLQTFTEGTFPSKIASILLVNNPLVCDDRLDWFARYLARNNVRTFLPNQQDVVCAAPKEYAGIHLQELLFSKTLPILGSTRQTVHGSILPMDRSVNFDLNKAISQFFDPQMAQGGKGSSVLTMNRGESPGLNKAIAQFFGPHMAEDSGRSSLKSDMNQLLQSVPNLIGKIPSVGDVDISKFPPGLITHVLEGGSVPGVMQDTLDSLVHKHMQRMAATARAAQLGHVSEMTFKLLPPLSSLDPSVTTILMESDRLPGLSVDDTNAIKQYYSKPAPMMPVEAVSMPAPTKNSNMNVGVPVGTPSPELRKLFPPGFDFSRLPLAMLEQASKGQSPDLSLLPVQLLKELRQTHPELRTSTTAKVQKQQQTIQKILRSQPTRSPELPVCKPNDFDELRRAQLKAQQDEERMAQFGIYYTAIGLGIVSTLALVFLGVICYRRRRRYDQDNQDNEDKENRNSLASQTKLEPCPPYFPPFNSST